MADFTTAVPDEYFAILRQLADSTGVSVSTYVGGLIVTHLQSQPAKVKAAHKAIVAAKVGAADIVVEALELWMAKPTNHNREVDANDLFHELEGEIAGRKWVKSPQALAQRLATEEIRRKFKMTVGLSIRKDRKIYIFAPRENTIIEGHSAPPADVALSSPPGGRPAPRLAIVANSPMADRRPLEENLPPTNLPAQVTAPEKPRVLSQADDAVCSGCGRPVPLAYVVACFGGHYHQNCVPVVDTESGESL